MSQHEGPPPDQKYRGLSVRGLTRTFGEKTAVEDLSFDLVPGRMTGFLGANGAGKTTTMRMLMGVLDPSGGEVLWDGAPIGREERRRFGYMPEERGLYPKQRILDQLVYLGTLHGMTKASARARAGELLEAFGLEERSRDTLEALSLGNQQRVQIAAALLHDPDVMILDEPFSGLDPVAVDSMVALLGTYLRRGASVLFSSHQLDLVERLCEDVLILDDGRLVASGSAEDLRSSGPPRYRVVLEDDAAWLRDLPGVEVEDLEHATALIRLPERGAEEVRRRLVAEAGSRGLVEFARIRPSLGEIYREVTGQKEDAR